MNTLPGLRGPLLLACLLPWVHLNSADDLTPATPFTSLPVREEMMAKYSNFSLESHNISLIEHSSMSAEKNITLEKPSNIELTCLFKSPGNLKSVKAIWKKDNETLKNDSFVNSTTGGNTLSTQYMFTIINSEQMGIYSCSLQEEGKERSGTFNFRVPQLPGKDKALVTYVGDSTVLKCACQGCFPLNWTWYSSNGSVLVPINVQMNDKYVISGTNANETKLKIMQLTVEDQGTYWCQARFQLGESKESMKIVVLSYLTPLKPFLAIAAEVGFLVAVILSFEAYTQKKKKHSDHGKECEQIEQLKSDDSNGIENNAPRLRKNESVTSE